MAAEISCTPATDVEFLRQEFVSVLGISTHVVTCGHWLDDLCSKNDASQYLVIVIPGNPGAMGYYIEFLKSLYESLQCKIPIWGISHAGHVASPDCCIPKLKDNENLYSLEGQILHKMAFINTYVPQRKKLILIGHSIGCYIILELLKRLPHLEVVRSILLFPTIERLSSTPNGQWVGPMLTYLHFPALICVYALSYLSSQTQSNLLKWYFKNRNISQCAINATLNLLQPDCAKSCMFMARDELQNVTVLDSDIIQRNISKIKFYYGRNDNWCPTEYYYDLKELFPHADALLCDRNFEHAFVLENSKEVATLVADWILQDITGSSKELTLET